MNKSLIYFGPKKKTKTLEFIKALLEIYRDDHWLGIVQLKCSDFMVVPR